MKTDFRKLLSITSHKAALSQSYGYLNGIHYMAPHSLAGVGNLCPDASDECVEICLGKTAGMVAFYPSVLQSRINKARQFMRDRAAYMALLKKAMEHLIQEAHKKCMIPVARLNGSTDIDWLRVHVPGELPLVRQFPDLQIVEYTKSFARMVEFCQKKTPANYHLTFSYSGRNWVQCLKILAMGGNVAICFGGRERRKRKKTGKILTLHKYVPFIPQYFQGFTVLNGDKSDLRFLDDDMRGIGPGRIIGLSPKGKIAKNDNSGFVVWIHDMRQFDTLAA